VSDEDEKNAIRYDHDMADDVVESQTGQTGHFPRRQKMMTVTLQGNSSKKWEDEIIPPKNLESSEKIIAQVFVADNNSSSWAVPISSDVGDGAALVDKKKEMMTDAGNESSHSCNHICNRVIPQMLFRAECCAPHCRIPYCRIPYCRIPHCRIPHYCRIPHCRDS
jgi:hypothetical protein